MKKLFLFICLFLVLPPVFAQSGGTPGSEFGGGYLNPDDVQKSEPKPQQKSNPTQDQWSELYNQTLYENYGSKDSPGFLNRENIEPEEDNNGFSN